MFHDKVFQQVEHPNLLFRFTLTVLFRVEQVEHLEHHKILGFGVSIEIMAVSVFRYHRETHRWNRSERSSQNHLRKRVAKSHCEMRENTSRIAESGVYLWQCSD